MAVELADRSLLLLDGERECRLEAIRNNNTEREREANSHNPQFAVSVSATAVCFLLFLLGFPESRNTHLQI